MSKRLLTLALTGLIGLTAGAGLGVAAAQTTTDTPPSETTAPTPDAAQMDAIHEAMRNQMPPEHAGQCDEMHESMGAMMGSGHMGSMMGGPTSDQHRSHHR